MGASTIDAHIGKRLRTRRNILGFSQEQVGKAIGVTFQQIQKYERGISQIGPSKLIDIAKALGVDVSYFFEGIAASGKSKGFAEDSAAFSAEDKLSSKETINLLKAYYDIKNPASRKHFVNLMKEFSKTEKK